VAFTVLLSVGGTAPPLLSASAHDLQARADMLSARWDQMQADGVPSTHFDSLRSQMTAANQRRAFGVGAEYWWPGSRQTVDGWESATDAIWSDTLRMQRAAAVAADSQLHRALGTEPAIQRKERIDALTAATTPGQLFQLSTTWSLEARLVPVDRRIAGAFTKVSGLITRAAVLGVTSDPAASVLVDTKHYLQSDLLTRLAHSEQLIRKLAGLEVDLRARLAAAATTRKSFTQTSSLISVASMYGARVSGYQSQVSAHRKLYSTATSVGEFNAVAAGLAQISNTINRVLKVLRSRTHIIRGVAVYLQSHALSCEETATSMALTHQGIHLSQNQILAEIGADLRPQYRDSRGILRWGNPYRTFVGSVDGIENRTGLQANYPPLVRVARAHGARVIAYGYMPAEHIYARLIAGHPVVVYATYDWAWHPRHDYLSFDGRWIPFIGPALSHVYTAVGVRPDAVLVNDPIRGQYWVKKRSFEAAYGIFREAIVFA